MIRKIIRIDIEKCNGCGACAEACHEGSIGMQNGKAVLLCENYCDDLGDCLPACPTGAITFEERKTPTYNVAAAQDAPANYHATSYPNFHSHMSRSDADLSAVNTPSQLRMACSNPFSPSDSSLFS